MKVTPLDLRQQEFRIVFRGFSPPEVRSFLRDVADELESTIEELGRLRRDPARRMPPAAEPAEPEAERAEPTLPEGFLTEPDVVPEPAATPSRDESDSSAFARLLADDAAKNAEQRAHAIVREAEARAELVIVNAKSKMAELQREIEGLMRKRREAAASLEATVAVLNQALGEIRAREGRRDERPSGP